MKSKTINGKKTAKCRKFGLWRVVVLVDINGFSLVVISSLGEPQDRARIGKIKTAGKKTDYPLDRVRTFRYLGVNSISMKKPPLLLLSLFISVGRLFAQEVEFRSAQAFEQSLLTDLFSSFRVTGEWILFNAADYKLYAYSRSDKQLKWTVDLHYRSDIPPFIVNNQVWVNGKEKVARLDLPTGTALKDLPLGAINTEPLVKEGKVLCTGLYNGGRLIEYDLGADSVSWSHFIAHGNTTQPFYLSNRIVANGEGHTWIEYSYAGKYLSPGCELETAWVSENPCAKNFITLTHDGREVTEKFTSKLGLGETVRYTLPHKTFLLCEKKLVILGDGLKVLFNRELKDISEDLLGEFGSDLKILHANEETLWIHESDRVIEYNYRLKKQVRLTDLAQWAPHNIKMLDGKIWLISREDGLLYCIDPSRDSNTASN